MKKKKAMPTIWEVADELWERMEPPTLEMISPQETGRRGANPLGFEDQLNLPFEIVAYG